MSITIQIAEDLDLEWTSFLKTIPWSQEGSIPEINKRFELLRNAWMKRMAKKYDVSIEDLKTRYIH